METIKWQGYEWLMRERWGDRYPGNTLSYYDPEGVNISDDGELILKRHYNPKIYEIDGEKVEVPIGIGLVSCTTEFSYGIFEIEAKLPSAPHTICAFWMWAFQSWPPEIDVFEAYTNKNGSYFNWGWKRIWKMLLGKFWRVETNIHLGEGDEGHYHLGAKAHYLGFKSPDKVYNKYALSWRKDKIEIMYNDRIIRTITDEKTLSQFRGKTMNVIINNGYTSDYKDANMKPSYMHVKSFKYTPYKKL